MDAERIRAFLLTFPHVAETMQWGAKRMPVILHPGDFDRSLDRDSDSSLPLKENMARAEWFAV